MTAPALPPGDGSPADAPAGEIVTAIAVCCGCDAGIMNGDDLAFVTRKGEALCYGCRWWLFHGGGYPAPWVRVTI